MFCVNERGKFASQTKWKTVFLVLCDAIATENRAQFQFSRCKCVCVCVAHPKRKKRKWITPLTGKIQTFTTKRIAIACRSIDFNMHVHWCRMRPHSVANIRSATQIYTKKESERNEKEKYKRLSGSKIILNDVFVYLFISLIPVFHSIHFCCVRASVKSERESVPYLSH